MATQEAQPAPTGDDEGPPQIDMAEHQRTYDAFMNITKWGIIIVVVVLIAMAVFLV
ncbi:MAG: aa3-type cytochrome c oxidase subunit IV [Pseudomonadota bacterium]